MSDAVWVLGTSMTRFGRYPELDAVDLASRACMDALADGGVTIHDMDVMGAGTLFQSQTAWANGSRSRSVRQAYRCTT